MRSGLVALLLLFFASVCKGQGILQITFDNPPPQPANSQYVIDSYIESGMSFVAGTSDGFLRNSNVGALSFYPNDGTAYIQASAGDSISFGLENGDLFDLNSVDLAGYSTVVPNFSVNFVGTLYNGRTVTTTFSGSGINFQTFKFGPEWSGLMSVDIPNDAWSLDNLVVTVPEPSSGALFLVGTLTFGFKRLRKL